MRASLCFDLKCAEALRKTGAQTVEQLMVMVACQSQPQGRRECFKGMETEMETHPGLVSAL